MREHSINEQEYQHSSPEQMMYPDNQDGQDEDYFDE